MRITVLELPAILVKQFHAHRTAFAVGITVLHIAAFTGVIIRKTAQRRRHKFLREQKRALLARRIQLAAIHCAHLGDAAFSAIQGARTIEDLLELQRSKVVSAVEILQFFLKNALKAHEATNCIVALPLNAAVDAAIAADTFRSNSQDGATLIGPLHGIPISVKDNIETEGEDSTMGLHDNVFTPAQKDAPVVCMLRAVGAVIIAKTNVPQSLLSVECRNELFGPCLHPTHPGCTPGGSSGGEAALVALRGSAAGVATDSGGSLRIPSVFCGMFSIKCSQFRMPNFGIVLPLGAQDGVAPVLGPITQNYPDLLHMFRVLTGPQHSAHIDGNVIPRPVDEKAIKEFTSANSRKLRIGYYVDDGFTPATPAMQRGVKEAVAALRAEGHEVIEFCPSVLKECIPIFFRFMMSDKCMSLRKAIKTDPPSRQIQNMVILSKLPPIALKLVAFGMNCVDPLQGQVFLQLKELRVSEYYDLLNCRNELRHRFVTELSERKLDALIAPGLATPAPMHDRTQHASFIAMYTAVYNVLDSAVTVLPVTTVDRNRDAWSPDVRSSPLVIGGLAKCYDANVMHGLPVGVQVVCPRGCEERSLAVAGVLNEALRSKK